MKNLWKWLLSVFVALVVIVGTVLLLGGTKALQIKTMIDAGKSDGGPPPTAVTMGSAQTDTWEVVLPSIGSVTSVEGITVRPEVSGVITRIAFTAGAAVETGEVPIELDRSVEEANLEQAHAQLDLATRTLKRSEDLFATRSVAEADLDSARSQVAAATAQVASLEAVLAKKIVRAPFAGRLGIKEISLGQFVNPGDPIVALQSMDPVFVEFSLPQRELGRLSEGFGRAGLDRRLPQMPPSPED